MFSPDHTATKEFICYIMPHARTYLLLLIYSQWSLLQYPDPYEHSTLTGRDLLSSPANIGLTDHTAIGPAAVGPQAHANFTQPLPAGLSNNFLSMLTSMTEPEK